MNSGIPITGGEESTGQICIHESVLVAIIRKAVLSIKGVIRFPGNTLLNNLAGIIGSKSVQDHSIVIDKTGNSVAVEVRVILEYGVYIPTIAAEIQNRIISAIEDTAGLSDPQVNVIIMDLEEKNEDKTNE